MPYRTARRPAAAVAALAALAALAVTLITSCGPGGPPPAPRTPAAAHARLPVQAAVQRLVAAQGAPGGAALVRGTDGGSWFAAAGVSDLATGRPLRADDRFRVGSITKTFMATIVLQLAAEGELALSDTAQQHLPALARQLRQPVTIRQLLDHTSGLFDYTEDPLLRARIAGQEFAAHRYDTYRPEHLVRVALRNRPYSAPGAGWHYSNTDYALLGLIVEEVTGRPYAEEIERRIIKPLKLTGTSLPGTRTTLPSPHGRAYATTGAEPRDVTELNPSAAGAAGELVSTLGDLNRFFGALLGGGLLTDRGLRQMLDTSRTHGIYGLGLFPVRLACDGGPGVTLWGHNGIINGSYARVAGTRDGRHLLGYRLNGDAGQAGKAEDALLRAEFCPSIGQHRSRDWRTSPPWMNKPWLMRD
jgi:D-alanyl-D-alanine carboxypeptidase